LLDSLSLWGEGVHWIVFLMSTENLLFFCANEYNIHWIVSLINREFILLSFCSGLKIHWIVAMECTVFIGLSLWKAEHSLYCFFRSTAFFGLFLLGVHLNCIIILSSAAFTGLQYSYLS